MLDFPETGNVQLNLLQNASANAEPGEKELKGLEVDTRCTRCRSVDVRLN